MFKGARRTLRVFPMGKKRHNRSQNAKRIDPAVLEFLKDQLISFEECEEAAAAESGLLNVPNDCAEDEWSLSDGVEEGQIAPINRAFRTLSIAEIKQRSETHSEAFLKNKWVIFSTNALLRPNL